MVPSPQTFKPIEGILYRMAQRKHRTRYLYAVLFFAVPLSLQLLFNLHYRGAPFLFLYPTLFFTGWLFGIGPGFLSLFLAVAGNVLYWRMYSLTAEMPQIMHPAPLGIFLALTSSVLVLIEASRNALFRTQHALDDSAALRTRLEAAIGTRDEFLSIASHELKTPLTPLKLQLQLLERHLASPNTFREGVNKAREDLVAGTANALKNANRLAGLIENLLDVTRINSGHLVLNFAPTELAKLVTEVTARFQPQFDQAHQILGLSVEPNTTAAVDRFRFEQILTNLLTNSLKYGAGRPVDVALTSGPADVTLTVSDQGIGIRAGEINSIFDCYERGIAPKDVSGLGLGLYIAKQYAVAHHGKISVKSELGVGSTFTVSLPKHAKNLAEILGEHCN